MTENADNPLSCECYALYMIVVGMQVKAAVPLVLLTVFLAGPGTAACNALRAPPASLEYSVLMMAFG